jgi:hypothetical protein
MSFEEIDLETINKLRGQEDSTSPRALAPEAITYDCEHCGHCENPEHCVWSVQCPQCFAEPRQQCKIGSRYVGLHEERWKMAARHN